MLSIISSVVRRHRHIVSSGQPFVQWTDTRRPFQPTVPAGLASVESPVASTADANLCDRPNTGVSPAQQRPLPTLHALLLFLF